MEEKRFMDVIKHLFDVFFEPVNKNAVGNEKYENVQLKVKQISGKKMELFRKLYDCFSEEHLYFCMYSVIDFLIEKAICSPELKIEKISEYFCELKKYFDVSKHIFSTVHGKKLLESLTQKIVFVLNEISSERERSLFLIAW